MLCPACKTPVPLSAMACPACGTPAPVDDKTGVIDDQTGIMGDRTGIMDAPVLFGEGMLRPGSSFGTRYRIESLLGEGGMGAVYKAYDTDLNRFVALKLVKPELASSPQIMQRFKQELLLASKISHRNILRIHDLGDVEGTKFISMAFVEGSDLADLIAQTGGLPFDRALNFAKQLCGALEAAHHEGVVHRDLKPQNILIDKNDQLYVSDFGLAKSLEPEMTVMTRVGQVLGTPRYMSPEQVEAKDVDHRSDLYSAGMMLYEMFTSETPFRAESTLQLMYKHVNEAPADPRNTRPDLPAYVSNVILKCLMKDPAKRYQSAREILIDLESKNAPAVAAAAANRTVTIQLPVTKRSGWWIGAGAIAVLAGLLFAIPATRHLILPQHIETKAPDTAIQHYMAVLPFRVTGDEVSTRYLADGVVDSISAKLGAIKNVYVAPASAVSAAAKEQDPQKLARLLGVKLLLEGSVTSAANGGIAVTITLNDESAAPRQVLHQEFSGVHDDLLTLEDQIFNKLVSTLEIKQTNEELARSTERPTENIGAYDLYLKGRNQWRVAQSPKDLQSATTLFEQAIKIDPRFALAYAGLADSDRRMGEQTKDGTWTQKALGAAQQAQALNDNLPEVHFTLGSIYTATGRNAEAIAELQRALDLAPNSDEALRRLGTAYMKSGRQQEAIATYMKATEVNPYLWTNFNQLGSAYFQLGQNDKALAAFQHVTEIAPDRPEGWANQGAVYYQQGKWNECTPKFEKAIALQPKAVYYSNLGTTYFYLGRYADSATTYEKAVSLLPSDAGIRANLADAYRWSGQTAKSAAAYDEAISLAFKAIQVNPQNADALGYLATCYAKKGDSKQAMQFIGRARSTDPKSNVLMYDEAVVNEIAGNTPEALKSLQQALAAGYSAEEAKSDPEFQKLRQDPAFTKLIGGKPAK